MRIAVKLYEKIHKKPAPYYYNYSLWKIIIKPIKKYFNVVFIPNVPFNCIRIFLYRMLGYKIGKKVFIGMKCYLDDLCSELITISDNVTISYGTYFACHGKNQPHSSCFIDEGVYIGMNSSIVAVKNLKIGKNAIIGACTLVNKDVPPESTVVGVPMKIIKQKNEE